MGRVLVFVTGVILFAAISVTCALAPDLPVLLAGRVAEGLGNVLMIPAAAVLVTEAFDPKDRGKAMGTYTILGSVFMVLGPIVGGPLVEYVSWRAVFVVKVRIDSLILLPKASRCLMRMLPISGGKSWTTRSAKRPEANCWKR